MYRILIADDEGLMLEAFKGVILAEFGDKCSVETAKTGRAAKDEQLRKVLRSELSNERATRLEGSFGTQKQHYSLSRIKARNRKTEILWIFFGIHTANAVQMIDKIKNRLDKVA